MKNCYFLNKTVILIIHYLKFDKNMSNYFKFNTAYAKESIP